MQALLPLGLFALLTGQASPAELEIQVQGLRNANGQVRLCLTRNPAHFPDCNGDPAAVKRSLPTRAAASIRLRGVAPGIYALSVIHDENGDGRLNRFMAIPREGFGFSRNPRIRMGPPRFDEVRFQVSGGVVRQAVQMRYLL
ncbi:MAG: DUF2141 domain-containing protein [Sphingosinicella sp.]|uniref:DUF2141 domain-containing protein n=1 Tax=Sphingosinicella sp. TaxID=1917971 RepID=UPI004037F9CD